MVFRFDIINHLIKKNGYQRYLEIGVEDGECLRTIECKHKDGVDPASEHANFQLTSDDFFSKLPEDVKYDIIFIDGLHVEEQVDKDIQNSLNHLSDNGIIVLHDCNPPTEWHQRSYEEAQKNGCRQWNGTVWRSIAKLISDREDLVINVVNDDWGCGLVQRKKPVTGMASYYEIPKTVAKLPENFDYSFLEQNRENVLNLISPELFYMLY